MLIKSSRELKIKGTTLKITSDFNFFTPYEVTLPPIPPGKPVKLEDPRPFFNGKLLADLTEAVNATVTIEICQNGNTLCGIRNKMQVLAYDQLQGKESYRELLVAYVLPNHPVISELLHDTAKWLKKWNKETSLEGYQAKNPNRVRELAAAAYAAIQKKNIVYAEPPIDLFCIGQRIRTPEIIMQQNLGTCMDMTLLYAACLEAIGLHPLLVETTGHIFAGVWLKERSQEELRKSEDIIDNIKILTSQIDNGADEMTFVECTKMCAGKRVSFDDAEIIAKQEVIACPEEFEFAIDVFVARNKGIKPIASRVKDSVEFNIHITERKDSEVTEAPRNLGISIAQLPSNLPKKTTTKRELWESKLLDLSQHNSLLNISENASVIPLMSSYIDELENALADDHEFHVLPLLEIVNSVVNIIQEEGKQEYEIPWFPEALKYLGPFEITDWPITAHWDINELIRQDFKNHRIHSLSESKQLDRELTTIYRAARSSKQENGVSSLYLGIGLMRWFAEPESDTPCYAPLILLPIEIVRKSANQGYALHARDEEPHFNTTLLEMLKQNFNLDIPGVDPLPADEHGVDIKKVFAIVRGALLPLQKWDVVESCVIGNFSFAQFAMWNDIHTAGDMLDKSKIVRSLMKGYVDWDITHPDILEDEHAYLPITVDATQLQAIKMAGHGSTFVLHGPPGTGKSQTITCMISNLLAQGKTVLFVAEKMAALSVVERRLSSLGIGDFCLELHSNKANKKHVLSQLEKSLAIRHPSRQTGYQDFLNNAVTSRAKLDGYARHLHDVHNSGYSLRELIDLYETVRDEEKFVRFDMREAGLLSRTQIQRHVPLLEQLTAAGEGIDKTKGNPLAGLGLVSYSAEVRSTLLTNSRKYLSSLKKLQNASAALVELLHLDVPEQRTDYSKMLEVLVLYDKNKASEPAMLDLILEKRDEVSEFLKRKQNCENEETELLKVWKPEFLKMDVAGYLTKHENAGNKFFGRLTAISAVVAELQIFALQEISYETIPALLQKVIIHQNNKQILDDTYRSFSDDVKAILEKYPAVSDFYNACNTVGQYLLEVTLFPGGLEAIRALRNNPAAAATISDYKNAYLQWQNGEKEFNELLVRTVDDKSPDWMNKEMDFCQYLIENRAALKDWGLYNQIREECISVGLQPAVEAYEEGMPSRDLVPAYRKGFYYALINGIISTDDVLSSFSGRTFNESIQQFKRLDDSMLEQTKKEIYYLLASNVPTSWDSPEVGMELNLLRKAIGSNARGMSIRALFDRIPHVLKALCPCMLMSPNSVAQYLAQDNQLFDVVVFDEASQLPTCKAIGALYRAKDAVIVGDPKQMPPTSFFAGSGPNVTDLALDDLDSILDDALALGIPSQHLQWHYRSQHESLIAFSNSEFYNNKMYTFPSANDRERHVTAVHVDGVYSKSTNIKEAEAIVAEIVRRFHNPDLKDLSIGVVTFNIKQQALIENLLAKQYQKDAALDVWANKGDEPLFIKNLENVQGDERDVILFSIGYGPDEKGKMSMNFGPINQAGGGKRLNVAFSRSRIAMMIFASFYSADIKVAEGTPDGVIAFKEFLRFAEGHDLSTQASLEAKRKTARAGILQNICRKIQELGFQYETMVGHSDFHVDIAVVDPYEPTRYMMGILLDGEGYRKTTNTRDREVAQIGVLNNLGWSLKRIWTIDWWDNREKVLHSLSNDLEKLKQEAEARHESKTKVQESQAEKIKAEESREADLRTELEKQAAEVMEEEKEAEEAENTVHAMEGSSSVVDASEKIVNNQQVHEESISETLANNLQAQEISISETSNQPIAFNNKEKRTGKKEAEVQNPGENVDSSLNVIKPVPYTFADIPNDTMAISDYLSTKNRAIIGERALRIVQVEAPILKEVLIRRILDSYRVNRSNAAIEATEKALKAVKIKFLKKKGNVFCWAPDQDPKAYYGLRVSNERSIDEICQEEMQNAFCYVLQTKGELEKDDLIKEASRVFGYKRLGNNLEAALTEGLKIARASKSIVGVTGGLYRLP